MTDDCLLDEVLDRIEKVITIEEFGKTKILINTDDILPDNITLKNAFVLVISVIKDDGKFHSRLFLKEAFYDEKTW